jgi:NOL1/NOP2/fmu family ribosome biogenesis protein
LDLCGAPGGKSTLLASLLNEDSLLLSNEVIQTRASILVENMCKWGRLNTWVSNSDPKQLGDLHHHFDIMLIDAPCSGSGLFRKIPDYIDEWTLDNVHLCAQRQKRILHDSYTALAEDGILVYMTCSFSEAENESIVDYILEEFDVASCGIEMPTEWGIVETISPMHAGAGYRFFPHLLKGEGFFLACFRKKDGFARTHFLPKVQLKKKYESLKTFVNIEGKFFIEQKDQLIMINETHVDFLDSINKKVRLVKKGIMMGKLIRNELIPEHELAMYHSLIFDKKKEITIAEAIDYLKREHIELEIDDRGWYLVTYENVNLGWIKNLGNRINNYYPSNYRILRKNILPSA